MNINREKEYIYKLMKELITERRQITATYFDLKERLDELTKLEQRGLTDLNIKGYTDLHNDLSKDRAINNIKRESEHQINKISKEAEQANISSKQSNLNEEVDKHKINSPPKSNRISLDRIISVITQILKESGTPLSTNQLRDAVNSKLEGEYYIGKSNFGSNIMYRINQRTDTNIEKVHRGYYQYRLN